MHLSMPTLRAPLPLIAALVLSMAACGPQPRRGNSSTGQGGGGPPGDNGPGNGGAQGDQGDAADPGAGGGGANDQEPAAGDDPADDDPADDDPGDDDPTDDDPADDDPGDDDPEDDDPEDDEPAEDPPDLPAPPDPGPYSGGDCPLLRQGANQFDSASNDRRVLIFLPPESDEAPGFLTIWHALGGDADQFAQWFQAASVARQYNVVVAVPDSCCSPTAEWERRADLALFDDLLTCVDEGFEINRRKVYATGFSAGGLWTTALVIERGQYLASAVIFSGGTGAFSPYRSPAYPMPLLLVDGGRSDIYGGVVNFNEMMADLTERAVADGHFVVECDHGLGHTLPGDAGLWGYEFLFAHVYGDGSSPFESGLPRSFPDYCSIR